MEEKYGSDNISLLKYPFVRTCVTPLKEGMDIKTQYGVADKPFEEQEELS